MMGKRVAYGWMGLLLLGCWACTKEAQYIETVSPAENPYLLQVDTFSGSFITFRPDSFVTSSATFGTVGAYADPLLGKVYAAHYFRYQLPTWDDIANNTAFDSLELVLKLNHAYAGDSTIPYRITVDRLSQAITNEKNAFYNTGKLAADGGRLGEYNAIVRPKATDSIRILLSNNFGQELFHLLRTRGDAVSTADKFNEYFKGLRLAGDSSQPSMVLLFSDSISLHLHYHINDVVNRSQVVTFSKSGSPNKFNQVVQNFSNTVWATLNSKVEVDQSVTGNYFAVEEFNRIRTRVVFPSIKNVLQASDYVKVLGATLELKPVANSMHQFPLPNSIQLYQQKEDGTLTGPLTASDGTSMNGSLFIDNIYGQDTKYAYDVTNYILSELTADNFTATKLVVTGVGGDSTLTRLVGNTIAAPKLRSRLVLSVLVYKKQS